MNAPQNTPQWYADRLGKITGSQAGLLIGKGRGSEFSKTGLAYLSQIAAERLISPEILDDPEYFAQYIDETSVSSKPMRIGHAREDEARRLYAATYIPSSSSLIITIPGSIPHPEIPGFASSPDGLLIPEETPDIVEGCLEIKCPKPATYIEYLNLHTPEDLLSLNPIYYWQCQSHMAVTEARYCDFVAYCPWILRPIHRLRIPREAEEINTLETRVRAALRYLDDAYPSPKNILSHE